MLECDSEKRPGNIRENAGLPNRGIPTRCDEIIAALNLLFAGV
jgi:hypothetical protein